MKIDNDTIKMAMRVIGDHAASSAEYQLAAWVLQGLGKEKVAQLEQLVNGPVTNDMAQSTIERHELIGLGLAVRIAVGKDNDEYLTAATPLGHRVLMEILKQAPHHQV